MELSETFVIELKVVFFFLIERGVLIVRENLNVVFIFYLKLFIFIVMGVIRNFGYRIESGLKKNFEGLVVVSHCNPVQFFSFIYIYH